MTLNVRYIFIMRANNYIKPSDDFENKARKKKNFVLQFIFDSFYFFN